jgi:hypothetical protein
MAKRPFRAVFKAKNPINMRSESQGKTDFSCDGDVVSGVYDTVVAPHPGMMSPWRALDGKRGV